MIGIIMLNTQFPRLLGDIGNSNTFSGPVIYECVDHATVSQIVTDEPLAIELETGFIQAARNLENRGAVVVGTSCGFLISLQTMIQSAVSIPVMTSSLVLIPQLRAQYGDDAVIGILTFDEQKLDAPSYERFLDSNCLIQGLPKNGVLYQCISQDRLTLDSHLAQTEVLESASALLEQHSRVDLFLIECTNISPYKKAFLGAFSLPVFDLVDAIKETADSAPNENPLT